MGAANRAPLQSDSCRALAKLLAAQGIGVVHLELHPVTYTGRLGVGRRPLDGRMVEVAADNARLGVGFGHGDRRQACTAAEKSSTLPPVLSFSSTSSKDEMQCWPR